MRKLICLGLALGFGSEIRATTASGIVYTCDPSIIAVAPQACTTLNTTIAGLYSAAFTNANASIYVTMGAAGTGFVSRSNFWSNYYTYSEYQTRLAAAASDSSDITATTYSVPPTSPYGSDLVQVTTSLQRALGFPAPTNGLTTTGTSCNSLGTSSTCYDGLITLSNVDPLYFRVGPISSNQYDFYTAVQHETDEILGTFSCAFGCSGRIAPADLFRYHSDGTRSFSGGNNALCSTSNSTNACFSLDGVQMLVQYNNANNGFDAGDWLTSCFSQRVQESNFCSGTAGVDISPSAEILILDVVGYTAQPFTRKGTYPCTNTTAPTISSIDSASAYGGYTYFTSGSWLEIKGTNLADSSDPRLSAAANPGQWTQADFSGSNAPTVLDGISVSINGKPAYVWYLSTSQINAQAPEDSATGNLAISVTDCQGQSPGYPLKHQNLAPGLLAPPNYTANGTQYMVATLASDQTTYVLNTSTGASFGLNSRPAKPGDLIVAYGVGFGDVTPSISPGVIVSQSNTLTSPVTISFGSAPASVQYQGLAGNFIGLYEFYINVPTGLANGDYQINVTQNGTALPQTMYLTVHN